jgi:uridine kinase
VQQVLELIRQASPITRSARPVFVAIDGCGGAGKTTLATRLAAELPGSIVIHGDDFTSGWEGDFDHARLRSEVLDPLSDRRHARYQRYDWDSGQLAEWVDLHRPSVLLVEGVTVLHEDLGDPWDVRVWVEAPREVRLERGLARDGKAALPKWQEWMAAEDAYVEAQAPQARADVVVAHPW